MKKVFAVLVFWAVLGSLLYAQEEKRGFYIDVGGGWAWISYPDPFNTSVKNTAAISGVSRMTIGIDLSIGYALLPNFYLVGSIGGIADNLSASNTLTLMTMIVGPGLKFYPLPSKKHLQLGFDFGFSGFNITDSSSTKSIEGPSGIGFQISVFGDFDRTMTGPALLLGGKFYLGILSQKPVPGFALAAKFVYKGRSGR